MARRICAIAAIASLLNLPAAAFDTYWHAQCSRAVGEHYGFTEDAWKILQLGDFSPDFFGPVAEYAASSRFDLSSVTDVQERNPRVRGAAIFLHFDNLNRDFRGNADFDLLFTHLLSTTRQLLAGYGKLHVDERTRKVLTLVTLGASLHAVQDFYSHSDWTHQNFGGGRVPTWFEYRKSHGDPGGWSFQVRSGLYPPQPGAADTHTHMNHDNSRLRYIDEADPAAGPVAQAAYHRQGSVPATGDEGGDFAHQQAAVDAAIAASVEWVAKVEEDGGARDAIEAARKWQLRGGDSKLGRELAAGWYTQMALSCAAGKWDGDEPPAVGGFGCRDVLGGRTAGGGAASLTSQLLGLAATLFVPVALRVTGLFWDVHGRYHVLEQLTADFAGDGGHYRLAGR